jgi:hypothetical protein
MKRLLRVGILVLLTLSCSEIPGPTTEGAPPTLQSVTPLEGFELLWGPVELVRTDGPPNVYTLTITSEDLEHFQAPFELHVQNGNRDGSGRVEGGSILDLISSATVVLDGKQILGRSDFSQQVPSLSANVQVNQGSELTVTLASKPGSGLTIWVEGKLKPGRARLGSEGGFVVSADGAASLTVPPGALDHPVVVTIRSWKPSPPVLEGGVPERLVELLPEGLDFQIPVMLRLAPIDGQPYEEEGGAFFGFEGGGTILSWVPDALDPITGDLTAYLRHFSKYYGRTDFPRLAGRSAPYSYRVTSVPRQSGVPAGYDAAAGRAFEQWGHYLAPANIRFARVSYGEPDFEVLDVTTLSGGLYCGDATAPEPDPAKCKPFYEAFTVDKPAAIALWLVKDGRPDRRVIILNGWLLDPDSRIILMKWEAHRFFEENILHELGHHLGLRHAQCEHPDQNGDCTQPPVMASRDGIGSSVSQPLDCDDLSRLAKAYGLGDIGDRCATNITFEVPTRGQLNTRFSPVPAIVVRDRNLRPVPHVTAELRLKPPGSVPWQVLVDKTDDNGRIQLVDPTPRDGVGTYSFSWETGIGGHDLGHKDIPVDPASGGSLAETFDDGNYTTTPTWTSKFVPTVGAYLLDASTGALHIRRTSAGGAGQTLDLGTPVDIPVTDATVARFDVKVDESGVPGGCGMVCTEYPANMALELELSGGGRMDLWLSYNNDGGLTQIYPGGTGYSGGPIQIIARGDAPQYQWLRGESHVIRGYVPNAIRVTGIHLFGAGWDFESWFDTVLVGEP